jgi:hypothetical protein
VRVVGLGPLKLGGIRVLEAAKLTSFSSASCQEECSPLLPPTNHVDSPGIRLSEESSCDTSTRTRALSDLRSSCVHHHITVTITITIM